MDTFNIFATLIVSILGSILIPTILYIKQNKDSKKLNLKVRIALSTLGAGKDYRYEYAIINISQRFTYITEVYLEFYEFNQFMNRIKYIGQVENPDGDELDRNLQPNKSTRGWIAEHEEFNNPNIYFRIAVYTKDLEGFRSNYFDPRLNVLITEKK